MRLAPKMPAVTLPYRNHVVLLLFGGLFEVAGLQCAVRAATRQRQVVIAVVAVCNLPHGAHFTACKG